MTAVYLAGAGLISARGPNLREAVAQVRAGRTEHGARTIPSVDGERSVPYFSMPQHYAGDTDRALVHAGREALAQAGLSAEQIRGAMLVIGSSSLHIAEAERRADAAFTGDMSEIARRAKAALGIAGADYTINTACTSSAHALLLAHRLLIAGTGDTAVVLGVEFANLTTAAGFHAMQLLGSGPRPFDAARDGLVLGEAVAAIVLTRTPTAHAVPFFGGVNGIDTASPAGADPSGAALVGVMRRALERAGITPAEIGLIKAHAAGGRANDAAEALALTQLFATVPAVTSLKGYLGHLLGASGCAELALLAGCWRAGFAPATAGCATPDAALPFRPLHTHTGAPAGYALLNFVGFGGGQASLIIGAPR